MKELFSELHGLLSLGLDKVVSVLFEDIDAFLSECVSLWLGEDLEVI